MGPDLDVCERARNLVSRWMDGGLPVRTRRVLHAHLSRCGGCRAHYRDIQKIRHLARQLPEPVLRPEFRKRLAARRSGGQLASARQWVARAAVVLIIVSGGLVAVYLAKSPLGREDIANPRQIAAQETAVGPVDRTDEQHSTPDSAVIPFRAARGLLEAMASLETTDEKLREPLIRSHLRLMDEAPPEMPIPSPPTARVRTFVLEFSKRFEVGGAVSPADIAAARTMLGELKGFEVLSSVDDSDVLRNRIREILDETARQLPAEDRAILMKLLTRF